ncbi:hypothetical protein HJG60_009677 [Phyllostomus discolor]|uniref:Uncharacterized protein n=1 Tax=Phyllostomus discolor TaxID=89673 RepID=A0A834B809_9CHIR|nr:hypothetical protein HJG60_009677 [Phyllostomus discolor]
MFPRPGCPRSLPAPPGPGKCSSPSRLWPAATPNLSWNSAGCFSLLCLTAAVVPAHTQAPRVAAAADRPLRGVRPGWACGACGSSFCLCSQRPSALFPARPGRRTRGAAASCADRVVRVRL